MAQIALGTLLSAGPLLYNRLSGADIPLTGPYAPLIYVVALFVVNEIVVGAQDIVRARRRCAA